MIFSHRSPSLLLPAAAILGSTNWRHFSVKALSVTNKSVPGLKNGMDYVKLGSSDLVVPKVCMGTMTFGEVRRFGSDYVMKHCD